MVLADSRRIPRAPRYSGAVLARPRISRTGLSPAAAGLSIPFRYPTPRRRRRSYNPTRRLDGRGLGSCAFARHYWRNHLIIFLSCGYLDVSVPRVRPAHGAVTGSLPPGFPIRTSARNRVFAPARGFSQLVTSFVASESHRHPPCALLRFPYVFRLKCKTLLSVSTYIRSILD